MIPERHIPERAPDFFVPADDEGLRRLFNDSIASRQPLALFGIGQK